MLDMIGDGAAQLLDNSGQRYLCNIMVLDFSVSQILENMETGTLILFVTDLPSEYFWH